MALSAGTWLGPYEILSPLGAGGMGEVYRARDSRLKRDVAIKVVPDLFASDPERLARFTKEAEFLATLNHPNIAAVHGLEESSGVRAIVLELVEGDTLADIIARGPLAWDDALPIATQIARALEAAHEKGIVHRDLKPANIKLRADGTVKVLDFGLAKSFEPMLPDDLTRAAAVQSPAATVAGVIMGTAAYMSPEQARGKSVDKRTDIWAFGCVLFEMLTGGRPFEGETLTDTIAAIVKNEPDWRSLPQPTPAAIRSVIARCLKKDPTERLRDIADGRHQLEEAREPAGAGAAPRLVSRRREWAGWITAVLLLVVAVFPFLRPSSVPARDPISFQVFPPDGMSFSFPGNVSVGVASFALSPDGNHLVFSAGAPGATPTLWLRSIDHVGLHQLPATDGAEAPFWSPDSRWIAFVADRKLKKIPASGGAVQIITDVSTDFRGGSWGPGDTILVGGASELAISSVSASGGKLTSVTALDRSTQEASHRYPEILPGARHFVYVIFSGLRDRNGLYAASLDGTSKKFLGPLSASAVYAAPGYLLFVERDALLGQAFDTERLELTGPRFLVAEHVARSSAWLSAVSASRTATVAFSGKLPQPGRLTWINRSGQPLEPPPTPQGDYADFRLSPDEQLLSASLVDPVTNALETWLTDLAREGARTVLPSGGASVTAGAIWSPDGANLMFRTNRNGAIEFHQRSAQGGGSDRIVLSSAELPSNSSFPTDWSSDGKHLVFSASPESDYDLWLVATADRKPTKLVSAPGDQMHGNFSPDGKLLAYTSNESGKFEIYVETVPSDRKWPLSTNGGYEPRWRADGRELYYLSENRKLMAVQVGAGPSFGIPKPLFQTQVRPGVTSYRTHYVPSRDGQRFLVNSAIDTPPSPITVVVNWTANLKK